MFQLDVTIVGKITVYVVFCPRVTFENPRDTHLQSNLLFSIFLRIFLVSLMLNPAGIFLRAFNINANRIEIQL